ncbi:unnamed protein product [Soboliphyme baturini]|uniref:Apple domain-containing protein n=1 Tax=Soboliphyme baturini TaxID=241478 RepID=A0A183ISK1_9BILA|nr:unnamed protein product [Soboliphyme baturini]
MFAQKLVNRGEEKNYMYFAERNNVSSVKECAKACWGAKFCKSATYLPKNKVCRLGYAQVARCSDKELVEDCSPTDALSVLCITCAAGGHETVMEDATSPKTTEKLTTAVVYADLQVVDSCFKAHPYKVLINAAMDVFQGHSIKECLCFCAQTWNAKIDSRSLISSRNMTEIVYEFVCAERPRQAEDYTQTLCRNSDYSTAQRPPCLEKLAGYVLNNAAAALIHGVSEDECRCHCYQSKGRDNYGFDCKSAMYYANERDCVLNIKDRFLQPNLLSFVGNFSVVSYLGLTCSEHTDQCFVEQPHHVLSGLTAAVESQKTVDECKCLCAESMALYDFACMSSQYDWNTKVCLLNNANRILNPKRFYEVTIPEVTVSYFDFICTEDKARAYISTKCKKLRYSSNNQFRNPKLVLPEGTLK